jgi:isoleucyl-tRNA synthetase
LAPGSPIVIEATVKLTLPEKSFTHAIFSELAATVEVCTSPKCERCWRLLPDVGTHAEHPTLCGRCMEAVG